MNHDGINLTRTRDTTINRIDTRAPVGLLAGDTPPKDEDRNKNPRSPIISHWMAQFSLAVLAVIVIPYFWILFDTSKPNSSSVGPLELDGAFAMVINPLIMTDVFMSIAVDPTIALSALAVFALIAITYSENITSIEVARQTITGHQFKDLLLGLTGAIAVAIIFSQISFLIQYTPGEALESPLDTRERGLDITQAAAALALIAAFMTTLMAVNRMGRRSMDEYLVKLRIEQLRYVNKSATSRWPELWNRYADVELNRLRLVYRIILLTMVIPFATTLISTFLILVFSGSATINTAWLIFTLCLVVNISSMAIPAASTPALAAIFVSAHMGPLRFLLLVAISLLSCTFFMAPLIAMAYSEAPFYLTVIICTPSIIYALNSLASLGMVVLKSFESRDFLISAYKLHLLGLFNQISRDTTLWMEMARRQRDTHQIKVLTKLISS